MLNVKYVNSRGEGIEFGNGLGYFVNMSDLHDFEWVYSTIGGQISGFSMDDIREYSVPVRIIHPDAAEAVRLKNRLFEVMEYDIVHQSAGKLYIGDYYLKCFCFASEKSEYAKHGYLALLLKFVTDKAKWIKEVNYSFYRDYEAKNPSVYLDYPYDFQYDYAVDQSGYAILEQDGIEGADFIVKIEGPVSCPSFYIADHEYNVNAEISTGEYLVIDSLRKKIYKVKQSGEIENQFHLRNRDSYVFEPIPNGTVAMLWNASFGFELTIYVQRSEPAWI